MAAFRASDASRAPGTAGAAGTIVVRGLTRRFGPTVAVRPLAFELGPGGVTGLLGPNGSGKSTLLRMLLGLVPPDAGTASVDGVPLRGDGTAVRRRCPYLPGEVAVYGEMSGRAHLAWFLRGRERESRASAIGIATELGLPLERRVRGYSHGMKRLLLLAAALAPRARVRVLDEPTEGLDPSRRGQILGLLAREAKNGTTILLSSHHLGEVERVCDRVLFLRRGELLDEEQSRRLRRRAGRVVRVAWADPIDPAAAAGSLATRGAEDVRIEGGRATFVLPAGDPRRALAEILSARDLPAPTSLVYGEFSLHELYRALYGEEGV
ncbi:MAG: ABC transporter ATP-binding protein [Planctomycetota bacterium]